MGTVVKHSDTESFHNTMKKVKTWLKNFPENNITTVNVNGTVKVHGANFGVSLWKDNTLKYQTRETQVDPINSNFNNFKSLFVDTIGEDLLKSMLAEHISDADAIFMYGELFGKGVQAKVGTNELERSYMVFTLARVYFKKYEEDVYGKQYGENVLIHHKGDEYTEKVYLPISLLNSYPELRFYKSTDFKTFNASVDLYNIEKSFNELMEVTLQVEEKCPVATAINPDVKSTLGEGIVWIGKISVGEISFKVFFKTKGEKHKRGDGSVKVQQEDNQTPEQKTALANFYKEALTVDRLEQGFEYLEQLNKPFVMESMGDYLKWLVGDVKKELTELYEETLEPLEFDFKKVLKTVNKEASQYYIKKFKETI